jgi:hypothetical protein
VAPISKFALLFLLLSPAAVLSQSFDVNAAFDLSSYKPLDGHQRWQRWWSEDGGEAAIHVQSFATAAYLQLIDHPSAWSRSGGGFIRRVGSSYGGNLMENSAHESLAALEGTDTRYFACGCRGFFRRSGHALKMTFLTYNRSGHDTLDLPQLSAVYGSTMVEATWWPHHYSALVQGVQTGHIEVGLIGAMHLAQEFSPEFKRLLHLHDRAGSRKP